MAEQHPGQEGKRASLSLAFQTWSQEEREGRASTHQNGKVVCEILYSKYSV